MQGADSGGADFCLPSSAFCDNERGTPAVQLALDRFRYGKLCVIK